MAKTLTVYLAADLKKFSSGLSDGERGLKGFANSLNNLVGPALLGAAAGAGALAVKLGVDGVKAALDDQAAMERLGQTLENVGFGEQAGQVESFIDRLAMATGVADDQLRPAFDRLARSTDTVTQAQELLTIALDVSEGTGKSLESVAEALGKAYDGNTVGLQRLGVGLDRATLASGDLELITSKLATTFAGQSAKAAETLQGRMEILQNATDELVEAFGYGLVGAANDSADAMDNATKAMIDAQPAAKRLGSELNNLGMGSLTVADNFIGMARAIASGNWDLANRMLFATNDELRTLNAEAAGSIAAIDAISLRYQALADSAYEAAAAERAANAQRPQIAATTRYTALAVQEFDANITKNGGNLREWQKTLDSGAASVGGMGSKLEETNPRMERMRDLVKEQLTALDAQVGALQRAEQALNTYADTLAKDILGEIDLGAVFDPENVQGSIDGFTKQIGDVTKFSESVGKLAGELPNSPGAQLLLENILGMGYISGQAFIEGLTTETANNLVKELDVAATAIEGNSYLLANKFHGEGIEAGRQTILGMAAEIRDSEKKLRKIGQAIGKPIGADIKAEIAKAVAEAVAAAQAAGERARAEAVAREEARQASLTAQAVAQSLDRFIQDSNARAGRNVSPVLT
jgi:hypothetical protein